MLIKHWQKFAKMFKNLYQIVSLKLELKLELHQNFKAFFSRLLLVICTHFFSTLGCTLVYTFAFRLSFYFFKIFYTILLGLKITVYCFLLQNTLPGRRIIRLDLVDM